VKTGRHSQPRYEAVEHRAADLHRPYSALARLLGCHPDEVAILSSATAAWQAVVYGLAWGWRPGDRILTAPSEYGSNYIALLQLAKRTGAHIHVLPETAAGDVCLEALESAASGADGGPKPVFLSLTHAPTSCGRVYDASAVGKIARKHGVPFLLDACQTAGQVPLNVDTLFCDFLSATGRKFLRAPRGTGFLYCRTSSFHLLEPATLDNMGARWTARDQYALAPGAARFESYEMSFAAKAGLGVAVEECLAVGIDIIRDRVQILAGRLRRGLASVPEVLVRDPQGGVALSGIVAFTVSGVGADEVKARLAATQPRAFNVSVSRIGSTRLDFEGRLSGVEEVVRASVHYYNSEEEVDELIEEVASIVIKGAGR
jgi:cysteine desulfurase / selenocysteine lyase